MMRTDRVVVIESSLDGLAVVTPNLGLRRTREPNEVQREAISRRYDSGDCFEGRERMIL
jgi:hypothetical protein